MLDRSLPFLKREALHAVSTNYASREAAMEGISNHINGFYRRHYPDLTRSRAKALDTAVAVLKSIYSRNVHPEMNIEWGSYSSHIGHRGDAGCFRCHDSRMVDSAGNSISNDCTLCHSLLSNDHEDPFKYLQPVDTSDIDYQMHKYHQEEFLQPFSDTVN
jgi:hypothetical protein